jgi:hypothetical protein
MKTVKHCTTKKLTVESNGRPREEASKRTIIYGDASENDI